MLNLRLKVSSTRKDLGKNISQVMDISTEAKKEAYAYVI